MAELLRSNRPQRRAELAPRGAEQHGRDLARIADQIRVAHARAVAAEKEWVAATIQLAKSLAAARARFSANQEFHRWLSSEGINISDNDRAALIQMARNLPRTRTVLAQTESRSWQLIYRNEIAPSLNRLGSASKTVDEPQVDPIFARKVVRHYRPKGFCIDPCCGTTAGGFIGALPPGSESFEIKRNRDFLKWNGHANWAFANPDWSENVYPEFMRHLFAHADNVVVLAPVGVIFTTLRTQDYRDAGMYVRELIFVMRWSEAFTAGGPAGTRQGNQLMIVWWSRTDGPTKLTYWD